MGGSLNAALSAFHADAQKGRRRSNGGSVRRRVTQVEAPREIKVGGSLAAAHKEARVTAGGAEDGGRRTERQRLFSWKGSRTMAARRKKEETTGAGTRLKIRLFFFDLEVFAAILRKQSRDVLTAALPG